MKSFNKLIKGLKQQDIVILVVFVIYVLLEIKTPKPIAELTDNIYGNIFVVVLALMFFLQNKPVVGIFGLIVAYLFIKRSSIGNGTHAMRKSLPSERKKVEDFAKYNNFPVSLEEEIVSKMAPLVGSSTGVNVDFKPVLNDTHDATVL
tara:strand:- start:2523 stop:2966 length:444 start_codon:yes stop_codon:yes gene_type:complete